MALGATICRLTLSVADMDRHYYETHELTIAQHPSENAERLMLRVLAFALFADPQLAFGRGLSTSDEPDLWLQDLTGHTRHWIDLGLPDEKRLRKACGRADRVDIIAYGGSKADAWVARQQPQWSRFSNLGVRCVAPGSSSALADMYARSMRLDASIQDGQVMLTNDQRSLEMEMTVLLP